MNYNLNQLSDGAKKSSSWAGLKDILNLVNEERRRLILSLFAILTSASLNLLGPFLIGYTIDHYVQASDYQGVLFLAGILLGIYAVAFVSSYLQTQWMGGVAQRTIFKLRNVIFEKIQQLPVAFFNENKAGDLISRVNNDTDKLSQFFSQALMQFVSSIVTMIGSGIFLLAINFKLGMATLLPAVFILLFTRGVSPWVRKKNALSLKSSGALSADVQESLNNFKVIIAFNRRDYFRKKFDAANQENYKAAIGTGIANMLFLPVFGLFSGLAQLVVLCYGIFLISEGQFSVGLLVSFFAYATNFYNPLRQLAALWASFQTALAGWDRISQMLSLENNLKVVQHKSDLHPDILMEFRNVHFGYNKSSEILHNISLKLERGKTYALVGPTGGGKTTTATLMARLYDPIKGVILLNGQDIRSYSADILSRKIGFILQEPFLFTGTVGENIRYGHEEYHQHPFKSEVAIVDINQSQAEAGSTDFKKVIADAQLDGLLSVFEEGLETRVLSGGEGLSLGQKQIIAFMRAVLRKPELLILDEATANIDTITEKLLGDILDKLPKETTLVIIAHRLNTIENADEIFFVNSGEVLQAGSFDEAMDKLIHHKRKS